MLQRTPTYVINRARHDPVARLLTKLRPPERVVYRAARWANILQAIGFYKFSMRWPSRAKAMIRQVSRASSPEDFAVDEHFAPPYNPWEQRLCFVPNNDLFKVLRSGDASVVTDTIETFTPAGVRLTSGTELPADVVVTATGFQLQMPFGGIHFSIDGETLDLPSRMAYKAIMLSDTPNLAYTLGYTNASWTLKVDAKTQIVSWPLVGTKALPATGSVGPKLTFETLGTVAPHG